MKKGLYILLVAAFAATACAVDSIDNSQALLEVARQHGGPTITKTFTANISKPTKTQVEIGQTGTVRWVAGDEISILDGVSNVKVTLTADDISEDGLTATFTADVAESETYNAIYPYDELNGYDGQDSDFLYLAGPSCQQDGSFAGAHIAVATYSSDDSSFTFRNVTGIIQFSLSDQNVKYMTFYGAGDEILAGNINVLADESEALADWVDGDGYNEIGVTKTSDGNYFIGTLECDLNDGFVIELYDASYNLYGTVTGSRKLSVTQGDIISLGALDSHIAYERQDAKEFPYIEPFSKSKGDFTIDNVTMPSQLTYVWKFDSSYGMKASAYKNKIAYASESWLISPFVNLKNTDSAILTFDHAANNFSRKKPSDWMAVKASSDGENWVNLTVSNWPTGSDWNFVNSGAIDLSDFVGGYVQVAFVYKSSKSVCGTWEVKNVEIKSLKPASEFYNTTVYGIYNSQTAATIKAYDKYADQIGYSGSAFQVVDPNTKKFFRLSGLSGTLAEGATLTVTLLENVSGSLGGSYSVTVGKVDGSTVWLYSSDGIGFIIKR